MSTLSLSSAQLRSAADIKDQIEALSKQLASLLGTASALKPAGIPVAKATRKKMSASARAKIAAAQKARWAKVKSGKPAAKAVSVAAKTAPKKRSGMSAEGRARIAAAARARWAKIKAEKKA